MQISLRLYHLFPRVVRLLIRNFIVIVKKIRPRYFYFLWHKYKNPEAFNIKITEGYNAIDAVRSQDYSIAAVKWFVDRCDFTLRVDYPLNQDSVVFDIGGHIGIWAKMIKERYNCYMYIFEPNPVSYKLLKERFQQDPKVLTYPFGLADKNKTVLLSLEDMGSSIYSHKDIEKAAIELKDIKQVVDELDIKEIDLIKINIEGGEYDLMRRMLESGIVNKCKDIQIQFHNFYPRASFLRRKIRHSLSHTHYLTYDYPFMWENWRRIEK